MTSLDKFRAAASLPSKQVARSIIEFFGRRGIGTVTDRGVSFCQTDRINAAILCLQQGADIHQVSLNVSWKDFEKLTSEILQSFGYTTRANVRFVRPRMEIDVVGIRSLQALVIDCKHWKSTNLSAISKHAKKQAIRTGRLAAEESRIRQALPIILTLQAESVKFVERIPIVPIALFRSFLSELDSYLPELFVIESQERTSMAM